jgi:hypothetical protein
MRIVVIPLGSGVEPRFCTHRLKPDELAVVAVINNLALELIREDVSGHLYLVGSNPV